MQPEQARHPVAALPSPALSHDEGAHCDCTTDHRPPVLEFQQHHVLPKYLGGPDTDDNLVWVCSTTHDNVHELLRLMLKLGPLSYAECQTLERPRVVSRFAYTLARRGFEAWQASRP